jgi:hypothetical protein
MPESNRNRTSVKGNENENRSGAGTTENSGYKKLPDNPQNAPNESISTADDPSNGKYSKTSKRDEDINNEETRGGR